MNQEKLREDLKRYKKEYGTSYAFIARKIGVSRVTISLFASNKRKLAECLCEKLNNCVNPK